MEAKIYNRSEWIAQTDPDKIRGGYDEIIRKAGFNVICMVEHKFQPQGYTAIWLLAESHLAVHTFPECGKSYVELSSCNKEYFDRFLELQL